MTIMVFRLFSFCLSWSQSNTECEDFCPVVRLGCPPPPSPLASFSLPLDPKGGKQHSPAVEGVGVPLPSSDDWTESLALCMLCGPYVWFGEATTTFVVGKRSKILTWMETGPFQLRYVEKFIWIPENFYFLSDKILTVLFLRSCSMPSEERKFYCTFAYFT